MLSVIICTSPGRESNLDAALACVLHQSYPAKEIIVVDDGSQQGERVVAHHQRQHAVPLHYLWRENDCCVARSRNLAAAQATTPWLVFLDADMLLNPRGLESYAAYLNDFPTQAIYGYFGYQLNYLAPSYLVPGREVLWCDRRFVRYTPQELIPAPNMLRYPHEWAWSGNFAIHQKTYRKANGFDERFKGWGGEDLDFAWRLRQQQVEIHFLLDAWAEQQTHTRQEVFHKRSSAHLYSHHYIEPDDYKPQVRFSPKGNARLCRVVFSHYVPQGNPQETKGFQPHIGI